MRRLKNFFAVRVDVGESPSKCIKMATSCFPVGLEARFGLSKV